MSRVLVSPGSVINRVDFPQLGSGHDDTMKSDRPGRLAPGLDDNLREGAGEGHGVGHGRVG